MDIEDNLNDRPRPDDSDVDDDEMDEAQSPEPRGGSDSIDPPDGGEPYTDP